MLNFIKKKYKINIKGDDFDKKIEPQYKHKLFHKQRLSNGYRKVYIFGKMVFFYNKKRKILHIDKNKVSKLINKLKESGINTNNTRNPRIIVSLTSFPARIKDIHFTIYSLLTQSLKPDMVILWLGKDKFPNKEQDLPETLLQLQKHGLTIKWCKDIRSFTKLIPALKEYPDDIIITVDDDIFYCPDTVEKLYESYLKNPEYIHCLRAHKVEFSSKGEILSYNKWKKCIKTSEPSYSNFLTGVGGVLYPPHIFDDRIFDEKLFMKLAPRADDVWFWAMSVLCHIKTKVVNYNNKDISVSPERDLGLNKEPTLWSQNMLSDGNDPQIKAVMDYFKITQKDIEEKND